MIRTQRGLSVVELIVALAILSLVGIIIWSVFFQGYNFSQKAVTKNSIQQEANLIAANLTKIQQTSKSYTISTISPPRPNDPSCTTLKVEYTKQDNSNITLAFDKAGLCYSVDQTGTFDPKTNRNIKLTIYAKNDSKNRVDMNIFLYRLK